MSNEATLRRLVIKSFHIDSVRFGEKDTIDNGILTIDKSVEENLRNSSDLIEDVKINIIKPGCHDIYVNSIMDITPISTKVLGELGEGITHTLTGAYVLLTGADKNGKQMSNFGSSHGILKDKLMLNRRGTPLDTDYIIHVDVILKEDTPIDRKASQVVHKTSDLFIQSFRRILKKKDGRLSTESHEFFDRIRPNKKKVVIIKQVGGQGAMHDNQLFPKEPSGFEGGKSNIDIGNVPIIMSPNEYRDGAIRAMT